jgi:hypothetical protein
MSRFVEQAGVVWDRPASPRLIKASPCSLAPASNDVSSYWCDCGSYFERTPHEIAYRVMHHASLALGISSRLKAPTPPQRIQPSPARSLETALCRTVAAYCRHHTRLHR